jgi:hypothetical protein
LSSPCSKIAIKEFCVVPNPGHQVMEVGLQHAKEQSGQSDFVLMILNAWRFLEYLILQDIVDISLASLLQVLN